VSDRLLDLNVQRKGRLNRHRTKGSIFRKKSQDWLDIESDPSQKQKSTGQIALSVCTFTEYNQLGLNEALAN